MDPHTPSATGSLDEGLPALVQHAELLWWLSALLFVVLGGIGVRWSLGMVRAIRARWVRRRLGEAESKLDGVAGREVTLQGTLVAGVAPHELGRLGSLVASDGQKAERTHRRWLLSDGAPVELCGSLEIAVGSQERFFGERSLHVGDRVVARGVAERSSPSAADVPVSFRAGGAGLRLTPHAGHPVVVAYAERPKRVGGKRFDTLLGSALGVAAWHAGAALAADAAVTRAVSRDDALSTAEMLAASAPSRLDRTLSALSPGPTSSEARHASFARFEMARSGDCRSTREQLMDAGRVSLVAELAPRCDSPQSSRDAARALSALGRFDRAHELLLQAPAREAHSHHEGELRFDVQVHVLAGRYDDAWRAIWDSMPSLGGDRRDGWLCVAGSLDVLAKRQTAGLRILKSGHHGPAEALCAVLLADALEDYERLDALESLRRHRGWENVVGALSVEVEANLAKPRDIWTPSGDRVVFGRAVHAPAHPAWMRGAHRSLSMDPRPTPIMQLAQASLAAELAAYDAAVGDYDRARVYAEDAQAARDSAADDPTLATLWIREQDASRLARLSAAIEVRAGDQDEAFRWLAHAIRIGDVDDEPEVYQLAKLVVKLQQGELAVGHDRGLGAQNPTTMLAPLRLVDLAAHWHNRERAARALGDEEAASRYAARAARFRAVLLRRDISVLLEVLSSI